MKVFLFLTLPLLLTGSQTARAERAPASASDTPLDQRLQHAIAIRLRERNDYGTQLTMNAYLKWHASGLPFPAADVERAARENFDASRLPKYEAVVRYSQVVADALIRQAGTTHPQAAALAKVIEESALVWYDFKLKEAQNENVQMSNKRGGAYLASQNSNMEDSAAQFLALARQDSQAHEYFNQIIPQSTGLNAEMTLAQINDAVPQIRMFEDLENLQNEWAAQRSESAAGFKDLSQRTEQLQRQLLTQQKNIEAEARASAELAASATARQEDIDRHRALQATLKTYSVLATQLMSQVDPRAAQRLGTVLNASLRIHDLLPAALGKSAALPGLSSRIGQLTRAAAFGDIASTVVGLISALGSSGPSADELLLQGISDVRADLVALSRGLDSEFLQVHGEIRALQSQLQDGLQQLWEVSQGTRREVVWARRDLGEIRQKLERMDFMLQTNLAYLADEGFEKAKVECFGANQQFQGNQINFTKYRDCLLTFSDYAARQAGSPLAIANDPAQDLAQLERLTNDQPEQLVPYLASLARQFGNRAMPAADGASLVNRRKWVSGAQAYLDMALEHPTYSRQLQTASPDSVLTPGGTLASAYSAFSAIGPRADADTSGSCAKERATFDAAATPENAYAAKGPSCLYRNLLAEYRASLEAVRQQIAPRFEEFRAQDGLAMNDGMLAVKPVNAALADYNPFTGIDSIPVCDGATITDNDFVAINHQTFTVPEEWKHTGDMKADYCASKPQVSGFIDWDKVLQNPMGIGGAAPMSVVRVNAAELFREARPFIEPDLIRGVYAGGLLAKACVARATWERVAFDNVRLTENPGYQQALPRELLCHPSSFSQSERGAFMLHHFLAAEPEYIIRFTFANPDGRGTSQHFHTRLNRRVMVEMNETIHFESHASNVRYTSEPQAVRTVTSALSRAFVETDSLSTPLEPIDSTNSLASALSAGNQAYNQKVWGRRQRFLGQIRYDLTQGGAKAAADRLNLSAALLQAYLKVGLGNRLRVSEELAALTQGPAGILRATDLAQTWQQMESDPVATSTNGPDPLFQLATQRIDALEKHLSDYFNAKRAAYAQAQPFASEVPEELTLLTQRLYILRQRIANAEPREDIATVTARARQRLQELLRQAN
jgi:hypothetical protein